MLALVIQIAVFAHLVWLGLYMLNRAGDDRVLRAAWGAPLALAVALAITSTDVSDSGGRVEVNLASIWLATAMISVIMASVEWSQQDDPEAGRKLTPVAGAIAAGFLALLFVFGPRLLDFEIGGGIIVGISVLVLVAGIAVLHQQVRSSGEALLPDMLRSYDYSFLIAAVFGGQIVVAMATGPGATETMLWLLHGVLAAAIATQVYLERVQGLLDRIAFANIPWMRQERAELREVENLLPRVNMTDPLTMDEDEFARLTRRALGHYGDLTKLATSPLTNLPEVHRRLMRRGVEPPTLERARELKLILAEAIERLRPHTGEAYGTTDEWRFYNALYYPYVIGMRPYSRRAVHSFDDPAHDEVLAWFRTYVPERTLYNWQNAAAALVAENLREQEVAATTPGEPAAALTG